MNHPLTKSSTETRQGRVQRSSHPLNEVHFFDPKTKYWYPLSQKETTVPDELSIVKTEDKGYIITDTEPNEETLEELKESIFNYWIPKKTIVGSWTGFMSPFSASREIEYTK